jgi:hypothetical protein
MGKRRGEVGEEPQEVTPHTGCCRVHYSYTRTGFHLQLHYYSCDLCRNQVLRKASPYSNSILDIRCIESEQLTTHKLCASSRLLGERDSLQEAMRPPMRTYCTHHITLHQTGKLDNLCSKCLRSYSVLLLPKTGKICGWWSGQQILVGYAKTTTMSSLLQGPAYQKLFATFRCHALLLYIQGLHLIQACFHAEPTFTSEISNLVCTCNCDSPLCKVCISTCSIPPDASCGVSRRLLLANFVLGSILEHRTRSPKLQTANKPDVNHRYNSQISMQFEGTTKQTPSPKQTTQRLIFLGRKHKSAS